jgi:hypothetical protein
LNFLSWFRLQRREDCDYERTTKRRTKLTRHDLAFVVVLQRFQIPAAASSAVWEKDGSEAPSVASWRILPEFLGYSFCYIYFLLAFLSPYLSTEAQDDTVLYFFFLHLDHTAYYCRSRTPIFPTSLRLVQPGKSFQKFSETPNYICRIRGPNCLIYIRSHQ